jgi:ABC-2 type transport system permease protein
MYLLDMAANASHGGAYAQLWSTVPLGQVWADVAYGIVTLTLWHAPLYGYLLALSAWVKKGPFLWAIVPPIGLSVFEKLAFDTSYVSNAIHDRIFGSFGAAFSGGVANKANFHLPAMDPAKFLATPGLWIGLVLAVALFALAVWLRRRREPM